MSRRLEILSLWLLGVTVLVVLWGAVVRVTGSGAGCADHWPLCNGEFVPRAHRIETVIEFTHRVTSSLCGLLSIAVFWLAFRSASRGSSLRRAAAVQLALMLFEGAIGALLVKKGLVAKDASEARAFVVGLHLANTFLLLAAQLFTWHFARGGAPLQLRARPWVSLLLLGLLSMLVLVGASGAVTALGDTLFPADSLAQGVRDDLSPGAHFLVRLRVWHPLIAVLTGALVVFGVQYVRQAIDDVIVTRAAYAVTGLFLLQVAFGSLNLLLLAPAWAQVMHLLLADLLWLAVVLLTAQALGRARPAAAQSLASAAS